MPLADQTTEFHDLGAALAECRHHPGGTSILYTEVTGVEDYVVRALLRADIDKMIRTGERVCELWEATDVCQLTSPQTLRGESGRDVRLDIRISPRRTVRGPLRTQKSTLLQRSIRPFDETWREPRKRVQYEVELDAPGRLAEMLFDPMYVLFIAPGLVLSIWASVRVKSVFKKYSQVRCMRGWTGAEAAQELLHGAGITDVRIVRSHGVLSDHYNPVTKTLALSEQVYNSSSIAAVGVATHEAGHAIQHARHYAPLWVRSALVPTANVGSSLGYFVMLMGLFVASTNMVLVGAVLFSAVLLFQLVTLPVEFNASSRAKALVVEHGIVTMKERKGVDKVLNAAALTYVAAAVSTLLTLLYFLWRSGLIGGRR